MNNENITYLLDEDAVEDFNTEDITNLLKEFEDYEIEQTDYDINDDNILTEMKNYELNYTAKQLLVICDYYGMSKKETKSLKKSELILLILFFEKDVENVEIVTRRKELWFYLDELKSDKFTKKFVIW
jgi:hypothetical protein